MRVNHAYPDYKCQSRPVTVGHKTTRVIKVVAERGMRVAVSRIGIWGQYGGKKSTFKIPASSCYLDLLDKKPKAPLSM